jgi:hypothetical protein
LKIVRVVHFSSQHISSRLNYRDRSRYSLHGG